jgi:hypothetical protein
MRSEIFTKAVTELATLPDEDQAQVLSFIETLKHRLPHAPDRSTTPTERYPLRGEVYTYIEPLEPAVPAEQWHASGADQ